MQFHINSLFADVQTKRVFSDGKTFVDCIPKLPEQEILAAYEQQKNKPGFSLREFVLNHYELPVPHSTQFRSDMSGTVSGNIAALWPVLTRQPDPQQAGTLIPLPFPYIVPGGRFGEIYYWDSYFTMLGLHVSKQYEMLENMVRNFAYLLDKLGYIPNGNRVYFIGRSQPPFFSLMVQLLSESKGAQVLEEFLPQLEKEYLFWINGTESLNRERYSKNRVVLMPGGEVLNRYWDENNTPRPESYREDAELAKYSEQPEDQLFRHLRAGAESGWDFSSRWFEDPQQFSTIHTTDIIPVDLNCLLYQLEKTIADAYTTAGDPVKAEQYIDLAEKRKIAIIKYCWREKAGFFTDYDWVSGKQLPKLSLAGVVPLFLNIASHHHADLVSAALREKFLASGGLVTTLEVTGQQWDAPNGWAPLHWMAVTGLEKYGHTQLAAEIAQRWIKLNTSVFQRTGKLMEKYNVVDTHLEAGGGEYEGQDGFGWTNGVLLALISKYESDG